MKPGTSPLRLKDVVWLCVCAVLVLAPHAVRLSPFVGAFVATILLWRFYLAYRVLRLPPRWFLLLLAACGVGVTFSIHGTLIGRDAGLTLLIVMYGLKLLEMRDARDAVVAINLGFVLIMSNFLYSQSMITGAYMLLVVLLYVATLVGFAHRSREVPLRERLLPAALILLQAVPVMLVLFILFPRVSGPLWTLPRDTAAGTSGLSDSMSPGSISELIQSGAIVFRAEFDSALPSADQLYWRGPVLSEFDGRTWRAKPQVVNLPRMTAVAEPSDYTVTLEPHGRKWLFALDIPSRVPDDAYLNDEAELLSAQPVDARRRYNATSQLRYRLEAGATADELARYLRLPAAGNSRARELAQSWRARYNDSAALVRAALAWFSEEEFFYTLNPPLLGQDSVDEFLFGTRRGFCEHYSGAFVFLMRAAGIPARVVTGYLGGSLNPLGEYLIVSQSDAHAWSEVWLPEQGWVRVDPTGAVAPARIEEGVAAAVPVTEVSAIGARPLPWLQPLRLAWDAANLSWNRWVLGYNIERQRSLLSGLGLRDTSSDALAVVLTGAMSFVLGALALVLLLRLRTGRRDKLRASYDKFCQKLAKRNLARAAGEGPRDFALRAASAMPQAASLIERISAEYIALRYESQLSNARLRHFHRMVREFRVPG